MRYRPTARMFWFVWVAAVFVLGWCGSQEPDGHVFPGGAGPQLLDYGINTVTWLDRLASLYYFSFFVILFILGFREKTAAGSR